MSTTPIVLTSKKLPSKAAATFAYAAIHPLKSIVAAVKGTFKEEVETFRQKEKKEQIKEGLIGAATKGAIAATIAAAPAVISAAGGKAAVATTAKTAATTAAKAVGKAALKHPVKTAEIAVVGYVAANVLKSSPTAREKIVEGAKNLPSSLANVGGNIGEFIENPSLEQAKETFKENPVLVGGGAAALAIVAGKGIAGTAATILNTQATRQNTLVMQGGEVAEAQTLEAPAPANSQNLMPTTPQYSGVVAEKEAPTDAGIPEALPYTKVSTKKRYKRRKAATSPAIHNSIRIINLNRNIGQSNRKYIKVGAYA